MRKRAFTLVELLIVLLILGVLTGIAVPRYMKSTKNAKRVTFETNLQDIVKALEDYKIQHQFENTLYPTSLEQLQNSNTFNKEPVNPYTGKSMLSSNSEESGLQYQAMGGKYKLCVVQRDIEDVNDNGIVDEVLPLVTKTTCIGDTMIEEGTTNLVTNPGFENGTIDGWEYISGGPAPDYNYAVTTEDSWEGNYCVKLWTSANATKDSAIATKLIPVDTTKTYACSVWVKGDVQELTVQCFDSNDAFLGNIYFSLHNSGYQPNWVRDTVIVGPSNFIPGTAKIRIKRGVYPASKVGYIDAAQIEEKPYATSWTLGGTTRSPETLTIPNANVFNKSNWNLKFQFNPTYNQVVSNKTGYLWENYIDANNYYALKVGSDGKPYLEVKSNGTIYQTSTAAAPVLNVGTWYDIKIRGNGSLMAIAVNGTKISEVSYVEPVGNLPANMYIGSDHNGSNHANALFDDLRISAIARSDTEWTNAYASGQPLPVDAWTTLKLDFNGNLNAQKGAP